MNLRFFDINIYSGGSQTGTYKPAVSGEDLLRRMDSLGISKALVWHIAQCDSSAQDGNRLVKGVISCNEKRLYGAWAVLPPQTREQPESSGFFKAMKENRIYGLRMFPAAHRFLLKRIVFGKFLDEVAERKIPVFFSAARNDVSWSEIYEILAEYPKLVCVICDTGIWGTDRYFRPLVEAYENEHFIIGPSDNPIEILKFLLKQNGLSGSDLGRILGQRQLGSKILRGERELSKAQIKTLAAYFSVDPGLFL